MSAVTKLMTAGGGGVSLTPASSIASDVTVNVPVTGVSGGTLVCSDSSGNVGIGVTPSAWTTGYKALDINSGGASVFGEASTSGFTNNAYYVGGGVYNYKTTNYATLYKTNAGIHSWHTAGSGTAGNPITFTQAMTLDSSGNLLVGTTNNDPTANRVNGGVILSDGTLRIRTPNSNNLGLSTTSGTNIAFYTDNGSARVGAGSISSNGSTTTYGTGSDYRMKTNVQPMTGALETVMQLNPVVYEWKPEFAGTKTHGQGFIAHELQAVVPDCVTGEKDAVDEEGNPVYQGIDTSFLVATLTKAIQELNEKVEAQAALIAEQSVEIAALKGAA